MTSQIDYENAVGSRYAKAAEAREPSLCCPVEYRQDLLEVIPQEIIERDYGCGDPSPFVKPGDTVLDLGSGGGKLCYIASQLVGSNGKVIGVDCNETMLGLARQYQSEVAEKTGFDNVSFRAGMIQNLQLDLERYSEERKNITATGLAGILEERTLEQKLSREEPLVASDSVDCVVSNCVLNLVQPQDRKQLFREVFRVLKVGGRAAISDIVSDEDIPEHLQNDPTLWSGCISGAWREDEFLAEFEKAGFQGMKIAKRVEEPWQTVEGIEFRSVTVVAYKLDTGACLERKQAVIYQGPFKQVLDDDGHTYFRGQRVAVCDRTFQALTNEPYADQFFAVHPYQDIPVEEAGLFDCTQDKLRSPRESKGKLYNLTLGNQSSNGSDSNASDANASDSPTISADC
ncbi:MAG: methyltransferase domain-containing protein [Mariniblastus sp.]